MLKKIIIARSYGFCMGVKRAINIAEETSGIATEKVTILNEIVHNEAVVEKFQRQGVGQTSSVDQVDGGTLIISAHGVAPDIIDEAKSRGLNVVDATCPLVTRIYDIIKKVVAKGYYVVHFGDPTHDETMGIVGHASDRITVLSDKSQLATMPDWADRKLALTIQTTSNTEEALEIQRLATEKWPQLQVFDTICDATSQRQSAILDLAPKVDMVLVVGSRTSANSKRLASIANTLCGKGILITTGDEIEESWFASDQSVETVAVSAGASTPEFQVEAVIDRLVAISGGKADVIRQERRKKRGMEIHPAG